MSARANWFLGAVEQTLDDGPDPFAMPIEEVGARIDLRDPSAALQLRLLDLLQREGNLVEAGVRCAIKDRPDTTCNACPVCEAGQDTTLSVLCKVGREQESVLTEMAVHLCRDQ